MTLAGQSTPGETTDNQANKNLANTELTREAGVSLTGGGPGPDFAYLWPCQLGVGIRLAGEPRIPSLCVTVPDVISIAPSEEMVRPATSPYIAGVENLECVRPFAAGVQA